MGGKRFCILKISKTLQNLNKDKLRRFNKTLNDFPYCLVEFNGHEATKAYRPWAETTSGRSICKGFMEKFVYPGKKL